MLAPGASATVQVTARAATAPALAVLGGALAVRPRGGQALRIPWAIVFHAPAGPLVGPARVAPTAFAPSDTDPAVLTVVAGRVGGGSRVEIEPVARLDVLLYSGDGTYLGVLARARDLLPGVYRFGLTGRGPGGATLAPGSYQIRLNAWPVLGGAVSRARAGFRIQ